MSFANCQRHFTLLGYTITNVIWSLRLNANLPDDAALKAWADPLKATIANSKGTLLQAQNCAGEVIDSALYQNVSIAAVVVNAQLSVDELLNGNFNQVTVQHEMQPLTPLILCRNEQLAHAQAAINKLEAWVKYWQSKYYLAQGLPEGAKAIVENSGNLLGAEIDGVLNSNFVSAVQALDGCLLQSEA